MPCYDHQAADDHADAKKAADEAARAACEAFNFLELSGMLYNFSEETQRWWREHKKHDKKHGRR